VIFLTLFILCSIALSIGLARGGVRSVPSVSGETSRRRIERLLIVGATGGTGRELVAQALQRGFAVTALVRDPSRLRMEHAQLRIIRGDVLDYVAVEEAVRNQEAVLSALGHRRYFSSVRVLSDGTRNIVRAMEKHGVSRFVCETSLGIGDSAARLGLYYTFFVIPVILPLYFWDKTRQERVIAASKLDWVITRPGVLTNEGARGKYRHGFHVGSFLWTVRISGADVAAFMLDQLASDAYLRTAPGVYG
jgi:putative NADH-flavin reductase